MQSKIQEMKNQGLNIIDLTKSTTKEDNSNILLNELNSLGFNCQLENNCCWIKNNNPVNFCHRLLEEAKLAAIPKDSKIGFNYQNPKEILQDAMRRLRGFQDNKFLQNKNMSY